MAKIIRFIWILSVLVLPISSKRCPPLVSETLRIDCTLALEDRNCSRRNPTGTLARVRCKPGYTMLQSSYKEIYCKSNGEWESPLFNCTIVCGRRNPYARSNAAGVRPNAAGARPRAVEFPWHVVIYRLVDGAYVQQCGGSLIAPGVVLSAAQCFWDHETKSPRNISEFRVAAGKVSRSWEDTDHRVQRREVVRAELNLYHGLDRSYTHDVAAVFLNEPFTMSDSINLVCVDWEAKLELQPGDIGVLPGWELTEDWTPGEYMSSIELPYMNKSSCYDIVPRRQQNVIDWDKFCAGFSIDSTDLCPWNYGGGMVFLNGTDDKYYIRGIASYNFRTSTDGRCYAESYATFTSVEFYKSWIHDKMTNTSSDVYY